NSFFFQAEDGIRDFHVTGVQTCALPILLHSLQEQLAGLQGKDTDLPIGLGLRPEDGLAFDTSTGSDLVWIEPLDATPAPRSAKRSEERRVGKECKTRGSG